MNNIIVSAYIQSTLVSIGYSPLRSTFSNHFKIQRLQYFENSRPPKNSWLGTIGTPWTPLSTALMVAAESSEDFETEESEPSLSFVVRRCQRSRDERCPYYPNQEDINDLIREIARSVFSRGSRCTAHTLRYLRRTR